MTTLVERACGRLEGMDTVVPVGRVREVIGLTIEVTGLFVPIGSLCEIEGAGHEIRAEVVGFRADCALLVALDLMEGIRPGLIVRRIATAPEVGVGPALLGRVIDGMGQPLDGKGPVAFLEKRPLHQSSPHPLRRRRITQPMATGIRSVDALLTCGRGQRMGIFSGSGVGKSILLGMMARYNQAPVTVIALVGERGREVREFLERDLGEEGLSRSVVVVATSDQAPTLRIRSAFVASAVAEYFRDQGNDVVLLCDSVTRAAHAQREIGLAIGEPPSTKGYPPSVYSLLSRLLERAGQAEQGSITGFYTVLVEADDLTEPIADATRAVLDGHLWLSRDLAHRAHFPAIDPLQSVSRVMTDVVSLEHQGAAMEVKSLLAAYREVEDLIHVGAYVKGTNPRADRAIAKIDKIHAFLRQSVRDPAPYAQTLETLRELAAPPAPAAGGKTEIKDKERKGAAR